LILRIYKTVGWTPINNCTLPTDFNLIEGFLWGATIYLKSKMKKPEIYSYLCGYVTVNWTAIKLQDLSFIGYWFQASIMLVWRRKHWKSNFENQTLKIKLWKSNFENQTLKIKLWKSNFEHQTLKIKLWKSNLENKTLKIKF
jgi:hypothetical protein